jgi:chromosome segregation ATPase
MQEEFLGQLTEVQVENARLELQAEVAEERRALLVQFAEAQVEFTRKTAELQTKAAQIEQQLHAIEQVKAENAALKARVAELLGKQPESQPAAHTATRPVPSVAK